MQMCTETCCPSTMMTTSARRFLVQIPCSGSSSRNERRPSVAASARARCAGGGGRWARCVMKDPGGVHTWTSASRATSAPYHPSSMWTWSPRRTGECGCTGTAARSRWASTSAMAPACA
uniref:Alternative protein PARD6G n=1 Tax=Homo sapiens TaxID=9606 RepID=L8EAJ7_HUMAN|nr:alternative protein PARD6G [Homo sapiens]